MTFSINGIKQFYDLIDSLDEDLKFIFENPSRTLNFLDIQLKYFKPCKFFWFKVNNKSMIWHCKRYFNCDSKSVIYILMCNICEWFYLWQTTNLKQRIRKHKSDVFHPQNSFCKKYSEHLCNCSRMKEHFFRITHFSMRIKKNYMSLKKSVSLWDGSHSWILISKLFKQLLNNF